MEWKNVSRGGKATVCLREIIGLPYSTSIVNKPSYALLFQASRAEVEDLAASIVTTYTNLASRTGRVHGLWHSKVWVGSKSAGFEQASGDVVGEVSEAEGGVAEVFESSVDCLGRAV